MSLTEVTSMGWGELLGNSSELSGAYEAIRMLSDANALVTVVLVEPPATQTIEIQHTRDVGDDTDRFTQRESKAEPVETVVGWMIPFITHQNTQAFVVLSASDMSSSVHFINPNSQDNFAKYYKDTFTPGNKVRIPVNLRELVEKLHTDGLHIPYEDTLARLVPTNPEHIEKINELLGEALKQAQERVVKSIEAQRANQAKTQSTLADFAKNMGSSTDSQ